MCSLSTCVQSHWRRVRRPPGAKAEAACASRPQAGLGASVAPQAAVRPPASGVRGGFEHVAAGPGAARGPAGPAGRARPGAARQEVRLALLEYRCYRFSGPPRLPKEIGSGVTLIQLRWAGGRKAARSPPCRLVSGNPSPQTARSLLLVPSPNERTLTKTLTGTNDACVPSVVYGRGGSLSSGEHFPSLASASSRAPSV